MTKAARFISSLLFFSVLYLLPLQAQDSIHHAIGIGMGIHNPHVSDRHVTPVIFRGFGVAPSLKYCRTGTNSIHSLEARFYYATLKAKADNYQTEATGGYYNYSFLMKLLKKPALSGHFVLYSGLSLSSTMIFFDYYYREGDMWATALESWYFSHSLQAAVQLGYITQKNNRYSFSVFLPVVSNVSRPEFSPSGNYNYERNDWEAKLFGETTNVFLNPGFSFILESRHKISNRLMMKTAYELYYSKYKEPDLFRFYMQNLSIGMEYSL